MNELELLKEMAKKLEEQNAVIKTYENNKRIDNLISMLIIGLGILMAGILKAWVVVGILAPIFVLGTIICYLEFFKNHNK